MPIRSERQEQESILVVDQDVRVIELLQITLSGRGYTVYSALDGEAALEEIERHRPDLAVIGVRLSRRSGFQVLEAIRAKPETARLPVILISNSPSNEARIQGLRLGADDYLIKPFSPRELIIKIRRILDRIQDLKLLRVRNETLEEEARCQRDETLHSHQEMQRCLARIGSVLRHIEEISLKQNLDEVFQGLAEAGVRDLGLQRVCFLARSKGARVLRSRTWRGIEDRAVRGLSLAADGFVCQTLELEGRTMTMEELAEFPPATEDVLKLSAAGFEHLTPICEDDGSLVALVAGGGSQEGSPLDRFDLHLLAVLARSAAIALVNAAAFGEARHSFVDTTAQLVATVEARFPSLKGHSARVHDLAVRLADHLGLPAAARESVAYAALLHDLGALDQYEDLFSSERVLTKDERSALRRRTSTGVHTMLERSHMPDVADAVYHLNECWNGSGLPDQLAHAGIPHAARIVALANAYDALIHERPHRPAYSPVDALEIIRGRAGQQFDPEVVAALEHVLGVECAGIESGSTQSRSMPTTRGPESRSK